MGPLESTTCPLCDLPPVMVIEVSIPAFDPPLVINLGLSAAAVARSSLDVNGLPLHAACCAKKNCKGFPRNSLQPPEVL